MTSAIAAVLLCSAWWWAVIKFLERRELSAPKVKPREARTRTLKNVTLKWVLVLSGWTVILSDAAFYIGKNSLPPTRLVKLSDLRQDGPFLDDVPTDFDFIARGVVVGFGEINSVAVSGPGTSDVYRISIGHLKRTTEKGEASLTGRFCLAGRIGSNVFDIESGPVGLKKGAIIGPLYHLEILPLGNHDFFVAIEEESLANEQLTLAIIRRPRNHGVMFHGLGFSMSEGKCPRP